MARKRKIPVRHHHGVRDPLKQLEQKEKLLRNVVNNPPEKDGGQKLSKKFLQFKNLLDDAKAGKKIQKRIPAGKEDIPKSSGQNKNNTKTLAKIKQLPGEEDIDYIKRVNRLTSQSLREAQYEAKYGVRIIRNPETCEIKIEKKAVNEIDDLLKRKQKERMLAKQNKSKRKRKLEKKEKMDPKVAKELIKQVLREEKEEKQKKKIIEYQRDEIKFGEVVHAPPTITTLPRRAEKFDTVPRPGQKNNLLLKSLFAQNQNTKRENEVDKSKTKAQKTGVGVTKAQLKGKRKELPAATRQMLENERNKFVELYRNIKNSKDKTNK